MNNLINRARTRTSDDAGFTLIELLIVIVILGVLAGIVALSVRGVSDRGEASACKSEVKTIATAEEANYAKSGKYASLPELATNGFLRSGTPEYVASADKDSGALTMKAGAPCTAA